MEEALSRLYLAEKAAFCIDSPESEYVLHLDSQNCSSGKLAATSTNYSVRVYAAESLAFVCSICAHAEPISGVKFSPVDESGLYTSSQDRTARYWDMRCGTSKAVRTYVAPHCVTALDVKCDGTMLCAGTEETGSEVQVLLWDTRKESTPFRRFDDSHTDDVTSVRFHSQKPGLLLSGSTDGLVNVYDVTEEDDDEALIGTLNTESSVSRVGFVGKNHAHIYALTHVESFHLWQCDDEFEDVVSLTDIREKHTDKGIDYLVDCFQCDWLRDEICLLNGSNSGQGYVMSLQGEALRTEYAMGDGHSDVIRSMVWCPGVGTLVTGGEDSMLCGWGRTPKEIATIKDNTLKSESSLKTKVKQKVSHKPF